MGNHGILLVIVLAMVFNELYLKIMVKRSAKMLTEEEFKTMRKAQVIDVREKDTFDAGHILGAQHAIQHVKTTIGFFVRINLFIFMIRRKL